MSRPIFQPISVLDWRVLLFPLSMVLYEFATYIANDMILPGMPAVVREFGVGEAWVPTGMSAFLAGGAALQWLLGPLSDRVGRRPVLLFGVACFVASCLATLLVRDIWSFVALRFVQGFGLCFVVAVGYAAIQEAFVEATAVKVTALMANVALISPLIGPLAGAVMIEYAPWRWIFVVIAAVAAIAWVGLWRAMPETAPPASGPLRAGAIWRDYRAVLGNRRFLLGALSIAAAGIPLLAWIGQSPVILIERAGMSPLDFGLWQIPVFVALGLGNLALARYADRLPVQRLVALGSGPVIAGLVLTLATLWQPAGWGWIVGGISLYAFGLGLANAVLYRLTLFSSEIGKGTVSASLGMVTLLAYSLGIELVKIGYAHWGNAWFALVSCAAGAAYLHCSRRFLRHRPGTVESAP
ncbi:multidrug transporter MdfA [Chitiniphilus shinanonensis]|uniref:Multidrug transporter MdfA n=1 Tax=Chitiniphilus shinanonensis TaxID=553088 RepID=A0ABQ6BR65_9NEIS|nr:MFS transporter [Chitiniphilus shinanonensis]GLS04154.1 multidrug transporter MdfA [Chitiniphilus shinanonensis]